jgi:hypothetical protein
VRGPKQDGEPLPPPRSGGDAGCGFLWAVRPRAEEAYFAIGELMQEDKTQGSGSKLLVEALKRLRQERAGGTGGTASREHRRLSSLEEPEPLALSRS